MRGAKHRKFGENVTALQRRRSRVFLCSLMTVAVLITEFKGLDALAQGPEAKPSLVSMQVRLFQNKSGTISENVLIEGKELRNAIAGPESSNAALIVVEVAGPPRAAFNGTFGKKSVYQIYVVAKEKSAKTLLSQSQIIPTLGENGKVYLPFWIMPSGCEPVHIVASIPQLQQAGSISSDLNFSCGE